MQAGPQYPEIVSRATAFPFSIVMQLPPHQVLYCVALYVHTYVVITAHALAMPLWTPAITFQHFSPQQYPPSS